MVRPLYHGTRVGCRAGTTLWPSSSRAKPSINRSADSVYITDDLALAKDYALASRGPGKAKVVEVACDQPLVLERRRGIVWRVPSALVVKVVWTEGGNT